MGLIEPIGLVSVQLLFCPLSLAGLLAFLAPAKLLADPLDIRHLKQGLGIPVDIHVATHGNQHVDAQLLFASADGLPIQESPIQDQPLEDSLAHHLYKLFHQPVQHGAFMRLA